MRSSSVSKLPQSQPLSATKPNVVGKQLQLNNQTFYIKGVTYGTFSPLNGHQFPAAKTVAEDFHRMAAAGINTVRVYTVPPAWLMNLALEHGLYLMVGIPWEQHIAILDDPGLVRDIQQRFRQAIRSCDHHPSILCYSLGNEIPANVVRWHGHRKIEKFLKNLYELVKAEDPNTLVTYVNFPTTEYLNLDFVDFYSFNVYLENEDNLRSYLARLQTLAADKPLVLAEVGLDSLRNGEISQSQSLQWQLAAIYECGAAGCFVYAWTDEWFVGGKTIEDWKFGLTTENRTAKPALNGVKHAYGALPFRESLPWPTFTVVVCSYNGSATIETTLEALTNLDYPHYEIIVVNDGSTDNTADIAARYPVKLISTPNMGLSSARNTGYRAGSGSIVAYIDDDAYPAQEWLRYLALGYIQKDVVAVGGPNYPVPNDGWIADCVANAPGSPMEVMLTDELAEHIPGCNMSFKRSALDDVGGFDTQFTSAGDDVDICWRVQQLGDIGFQPAAFNWHHRRGTIKGYLKQQYGYGKAEAMLEKKWPEKYNHQGQAIWHGRLYGQGVTRQLLKTRSRIYQGVWGCSPFQRLYHSHSPGFLSMPLMPEWLIVITMLAVGAGVTALLGASLWAFLPLVLAVGVYVGQAFYSAIKGKYQLRTKLNTAYAKRVLLTSFLHIAQPVMRLRGRIGNGLHPMGLKTGIQSEVKTNALYRKHGLWDGKYQSAIDRLNYVRSFVSSRTRCVTGNQFDNWDLQVYGGAFASAKLSLMVEHHGENSEFVRYRVSQRWSVWSFIFTGVFALFALTTLLAKSYIAVGFSLLCIVLIAWKSFNDGALAIGLTEDAIARNVAEELTELPATTTDSDLLEEVLNVA